MWVTAFTYKMLNKHNNPFLVVCTVVKKRKKKKSWHENIKKNKDKILNTSYKSLLNGKLVFFFEKATGDQSDKPEMRTGMWLRHRRRQQRWWWWWVSAEVNIRAAGYKELMKEAKTSTTAALPWLSPGPLLHPLHQKYQLQDHIVALIVEGV